MKRRNFLKAMASLGAAVVMSPSVSGAPGPDGSRPRPDGSRPNIIYILADDLGYGHLGCYGQKEIVTPHLDRMAAEGMRFTDHYAGSALCAPSRCVLITGLHTGVLITGLHTGHCFIRNNKPLPVEGNVPIPAGSQTIPKLLKKAGYATACIGKWGRVQLPAAGPQLLSRAPVAQQREGHSQGQCGRSTKGVFARPADGRSPVLRSPKSQGAVLPLPALHDSAREVPGPRPRRLRRQTLDRNAEGHRRDDLAHGQRHRHVAGTAERPGHREEHAGDVRQ